MLPNHVVRDMDQFRVLFRPDPCAYQCLSQPGPPSLFAQAIIEQNALFYATFPEARRAEEERRQERERLLAKYWQKLQDYGLPMHFGSPFFPRDFGEEECYHNPGYVEYPTDGSCSSFVPSLFSATAARVGPLHSPAPLGDISAVDIFNDQCPSQDTFPSPAHDGLRAVANALSPNPYDHLTDSNTTSSFGVGIAPPGTLHQVRTPQVPRRTPHERNEGHQPSFHQHHSPHRHFQQHPQHQSQHDQHRCPSQLPPLDLSPSLPHSMVSEDDEGSTLSTPISSYSQSSKTNKSPGGLSLCPRRNPRGGAMRLSPLPTNKRQVEKKPPLACLFCRGRKIACGAPLPGSLDKTCNQCQRRSLQCHYPTESRRGMRKKKAAEGTKDVIDQTLPGEAVLTP